MADIVVCGGSIIGLSAAMILARDGHDVTVLERDPAPVPESWDEAWDQWERPSVPQLRQPHNLFPRYREVLEAELPDVFAGLVAHGGTWVNFVANLPPFVTDRAPRPDDDRFAYVTGRRPMVEFVHARAAEEEPRVTVRRGARVRGFVTGPGPGRGSNDTTHVVGIETDDGVLRADLVVDAMGRRSPAVEWFEALGAWPPVVESQDSGYTYYTQYFSGELPAPMSPPVVAIGTFLLLTIWGDNSTWSVTLWAPSADRPLKEFRDATKFARVVQACPLHAHWLDGTPITDVLPMGGILDKYRRFVVDDTPIATGYAAVGDAWACTNPSAGRGLSIGLLHAQRLRDVVRGELDDPLRFARAWDAVTEAEIAPWYWHQLATDRARLEEMTAVREGRAEMVSSAAPLPPQYALAERAAGYDADVFRAVVETIGCLALPEEVFARPGLWDKVVAAAPEERVAMPGPTREELLALLA
jgi:2-polyprenyl-6-methoxyphenol hydroxylase-like FAD-dependent oxidoreductase